MYALITKQFIRSKTVVVACVLILGMGVISTLIGRQFLTEQEQAIAEVTQHQQEHIGRNVRWHADEMGLLLYYLRFALVDAPDRLAALSIGQRDVHPTIQSVTIRNLEGQQYDTDLNNPTNLQSGNLDLGFVIIYLFPLLIIAFTYDLFSQEKETGTWRLVAVQSPSPLWYLLYKLSVRALLLYAVLLALFAIAIPLLSLPLDQALGAFVVLSLLYVAFWFALGFLVVSFQRSSSFNVLTLLSLWVVLTILLPAFVNNFLANRYPVPEALSTMVKQRDGYHEKWDTDKEATVNKFFAHYPQYQKYTLPDEDFSWLWYYAMQQMGDDESRQQSQAMREKIRQREQASRWWALAIPTLHTQLQFNELARTGLGNHLEFLDRTRAFHERMRLYFYPKIFDNAAVEAEDWSQFRPEYTSEKPEVHWPVVVLPLLITIAVVSLLSVVNLRRFKTT